MGYKIVAVYLAADSGGLGPQNKMAYRTKIDHCEFHDDPEGQRVWVRWRPPSQPDSRKEPLQHDWFVPYGQIRYAEVERTKDEK